jgi:hypothetical protein
MRQRLERFRAACEEYDQENRRSGFNGSPGAEQLYSEINSAVPTVREIVKLLAPDLVERIKPPSHMLGASGAGAAAEQALGILRDQDEWKANLAPDAPSLVADQFHPTVWNAASAIWDTGSYRIAVLQSAVSLSTHVAAKAISGLAERELVNEVFAPADPCRARRGFTSRGTRRARPGGRARMGCTCSLKEHSRELGT